MPSHFYSFSFERKADWSRKFSPQVRSGLLPPCVDKYGLRPHIRFGSELRAARFDGRRASGVFTAAGEELEAEVLASGVGQLNRPRTCRSSRPRDFRGARSTRGLDHGVDLAGKRVR